MLGRTATGQLHDAPLALHFDGVGDLADFAQAECGAHDRRFDQGIGRVGRTPLLVEIAEIAAARTTFGIEAVFLRELPEALGVRLPCPRQ